MASIISFALKYPKNVVTIVLLKKQKKYYEKIETNTHCINLNVNN
jgi:hypothetical protein